MWKRKIWLCVPPFVLCMLDQSITLFGQSAEYWAGNRSVANEGNPWFLWLLRQHPLAFEAGIAAWVTVFCALMVPIPFGYPSYFSHYMFPRGIESNRILLSEEQSTGSGCSGLYTRKYGPMGIVLDLGTGKAIRKYATLYQDQKQHRHVTDYKVVDANPDILLDWQDDSGTHSTKILTLKRLVQMGSGTEESERIGDTLIIYIYHQFVISVDLKVLGDSSSPRT